MQGQTEAEHRVGIAIEVDVVRGIQIKAGHLVHRGDD